MSETPQIVVSPIDRFRRNLSELKSPAYLEAHLRQEYLNPFSKALGWDMDNQSF
jgi:predicted type IV restriction endonuclease